MTQPEQPTVALVPIARTTFDTGLAEAITARIRTRLSQAGLKLVGPAGLICSLAEAQQAASTLSKSPPDLLVILQATFADSIMVLALAEQIEAPLLLWAVPEAHSGGRLRLNSLCGINLAGPGLTRAGFRYDYLYAGPDETTAISQLQTMTQAGRVRRRLGRSRIGRVGEHPAGFDTCRYDKVALKHTFGVEVVELELAGLFDQVRQVEADDVAVVAEQLQPNLTNLAELDQGAVRGTLSTYVTLRRLAARQKLNGFAMRCWPEFFTELGCAACGTLSMLSNEATPCSCEADVNGSLSQLIL
jgi:L-fucose isomerase-like protein